MHLPMWLRVIYAQSSESARFTKRAETRVDLDQSLLFVYVVEVSKKLVAHTNGQWNDSTIIFRTTKNILRETFSNDILLSNYPRGERGEEPYILDVTGWNKKIRLFIFDRIFMQSSDATNHIYNTINCLGSFLISPPAIIKCKYYIQVSIFSKGLYFVNGLLQFNLANTYSRNDPT